MHKICIKYAEICKNKYAKKMLDMQNNMVNMQNSTQKICRKYAENMQKKYAKYSKKNMQKLCKNYVKCKIMQNFSSKKYEAYAKNMQQYATICKTICRRPNQYAAIPICRMCQEFAKICKKICKICSL